MECVVLENQIPIPHDMKVNDSVYFDLQFEQISLLINNEEKGCLSLELKTLPYVYQSKYQPGRTFKVVKENDGCRLRRIS